MKTQEQKTNIYQITKFENGRKDVRIENWENKIGLE